MSLGLTENKNLPIKVVKEPANAGLNSFNHRTGLRGDISEANFSGPSHLKILSEICISTIFHGYEYEICLFHNITQKELRSGLSGYAGILGVWKGWQIEDNHLKSMVFSHGDMCNNDRRNATVNLHCMNTPLNGSDVLPLLQLESVVESPTCVYNVTLSTPLVCHEESMLVYPLLRQLQREKWQKLMLSKARGQISQEQYDVKLREIFRESGLLPPLDDSTQNKDQFQPMKSVVPTPRYSAGRVANVAEAMNFQAASLQACNSLLMEKDEVIRQLREELSRLVANRTEIKLSL